MQIDFFLKNTHITGAEVKTFLEDKTSKLERYFQGKIHARWTISYQNDEHITHLHVTGNSLEFFAEERQHNLFSAVEETIEKVERQLQKRKEMIKDHHR